MHLGRQNRKETIAGIYYGPPKPCDNLVLWGTGQALSRDMKSKSRAVRESNWLQGSSPVLLTGTVLLTDITNIWQILMATLMAWTSSFSRKKETF
jgi:hypothetical protein